MGTRKTTGFANAESATLVAQLRRESRLNPDYFNSSPLGFVLDEALKLEVAPVAYPIVHSLAKPSSPYSFEVFHHYLSTIKSGDYALADVVINPSHEPLLSATQLLKKPFGGASAFSLKNRTQMLKLPLNLLNLGGVEEPAVACDGEIVNSEVNAKNTFLQSVVNGTSLFRKTKRKISPSSPVNPEQAFSQLPISEVSNVTGWNFDNKLLPAVQRDYAENVSFETCGTCEVVADRSPLDYRLALGSFNNSASLLNASHSKLSRKLISFSKFPIDNVMKLNIIPNPAIPSSINAELQRFAVSLNSSNYLIGSDDFDLGNSTTNHTRQQKNTTKYLSRAHVQCPVLPTKKSESFRKHNNSIAASGGVSTKMKKNRCFSLTSAAACFVLLLGFMLVLGAVSASATLNVRADKEVYNLGDYVAVNYDFSRDQDFSGLLKLSLFCTSFELEFYTLPTNLNAGEKQEVSVPPLSIARDMLGRCYITANATSFDKSVSEDSTSNFFNVTSNVSIALLLGMDSYLPSQSVEVSGTVGKSHELPAGVVLAFLGTKYASAVAGNAFAYSIKLPKNIKSGGHVLEFLVNDSYGNSGFASAGFKVESVPTRMVNTLSNNSVRPGEPFTVSASVYDQADDAMHSVVSITVADSAGTVVLSASNTTDGVTQLLFPIGQKPGRYTLVSKALGLTEASLVLVEEVEEASVRFDNKTVVLRNTGNVNYVKQFNITLSGKKSYVVVHDVELAPGEVFEVDLTKAVSKGDYTISFPTVGNASQLDGVHLEDERSLIKKTSDFFGITGKAVKVTSTGTGNAQAKFVLLLLAIAGVLAFFFAKGRGKGKGSSNISGTGYSGSRGASEKSVQRPVQQQMADDEESRVKRIIEEKRRQQLERQPLQPKTLDRNSPESKKFLSDIMKDKQFR